MVLFKGALISLLLPVWAIIGLVAIGAASFAVSVAEDPTIEQELLDLGFGTGTGTMADANGALAAVVVAGLVVHVMAAVATSRAVAAMAGSIGGLLGTAIGGLAAAAIAVAPSGERVDGLRALTHPASVAAIGAISLVLGFRASLAHTGRWRYAKPDHGSWGDDWGGDFGD